MGSANARGNYEERKAQAIAAGRVTPRIRTRGRFKALVRYLVESGGGTNGEIESRDGRRYQVDGNGTLRRTAQPH